MPLLAQPGPIAFETPAKATEFRPTSPRVDYRPGPPVYAALDLGTNNCRLLVARPSRRGFKVVDAVFGVVEEFDLLHGGPR